MFAPSQYYDRDNYSGFDAAITEAIMLFLSPETARQSHSLLYVFELKGVFFSFLKDNLQRQLI